MWVPGLERSNLKFRMLDTLNQAAAAANRPFAGNAARIALIITANSAPTVTINGVIWRGATQHQPGGLGTVLSIHKDMVGDHATLPGVAVWASVTDLQICEVYIDAKDPTI